MRWNAETDKKSDMLYDYMDKSDFYLGTAEKNSRSMMNVTFRLKSEELEKKFIGRIGEEFFGWAQKDTVL